MQILNIITHAMGMNNTWCKERDIRYTEKFLDIGEVVILNNINNFINWLEEIFWTKKQNPSAYRSDSLRALLGLHLRLSHTGIAYSYNFV